MAIAPVLEPHITSIQAHYHNDLETIRHLHENGENAHEVVRLISDATDSMILRVLDDLLKSMLTLDDLPPNMLLLAQGGYGRREMHPQSDVDIIFLYHQRLSDEQGELVKCFFRTLYDMNFKVGHACRSFREAFEMASSDPHSQTALFESRFLAGDWRLFESFKHQLWQYTRRFRKDYMRRKIEERDKRLARFGSTINITEPHIKESPGGLRDYHFGIWMGSLMMGRTLKLLHMKRSYLIDDDTMKGVEAALEFLWRLRTDLHFLTGKEQDLLAMPLQHKVSERLNYHDTQERLAEEKMMRDYYRHARRLQEFADRMAHKAQIRPWWHALRLNPRKELSEGFFIKNNQINIPPDIHFFEHNPQRLLIAFIHCAIQQRRLSEETLNAIRDNKDLIDQAFLLNRQTAALVQHFFGLPCPIEEAIQAMRITGVLENIFPEWRSIAQLVRYDLAHKYTVDEHSLLCLYNLEHLEDDSHSFSRERSLVWKQCKEKDVLRMAVLFHDVGKGKNIDHSVAGARMVDDIARRFRLPEPKRNLLVFLVRHHLLMSRTAQHRDIADPDVVADFCDAFERAEDLDMMYLLTYVDIQSVSHESMTEWKNNLLWQLYLTSHDVSQGGHAAALDPHDQAVTRKQALIETLQGEYSAEEVQNHLALLPSSYMLHQSAEMIRRHLQMIRHFPETDPIVEIISHVDPHCREIVLVTNDRLGLFHEICVAVMLENFVIIEARLNTRDDGIVVNNIVIRDEIADNNITETREQLLQSRLVEILQRDGAPPALPKSPKSHDVGRSRFRSHVKILNDVSAHFNIIEIRGQDRPGILTLLTEELANLRLNIDFARIITQGNRVTDIFYVTDENGEKIEDEQLIKQTKQALEKLL